MKSETLNAERLRIAVTGSSGLVGSRLCQHLQKRGHLVIPVVRSRRAEEDHEVYWRPNEGDIDAAGLEGVDAVVHLAGENIFGRWTQTKKKRILESREKGTELISRSLAGLRKPPAALICASAVGYYGDTDDEVVDEQDEAGEGFLAGVCRVWENATLPARRAGIRTVCPRLGIVLSARGGALSLMHRVFRFGLGGQLGSGRQYMSWIHIDDLVRILDMLIVNDQLDGPVNAVAPDAVTNREFTKTLGRVLHRPTCLWVPALMAKMVLGEMAREMLLAGQRVEPRKLRENGFEFGYPELEPALRHELGRR